MYKKKIVIFFLNTFNRDANHPNRDLVVLIICLDQNLYPFKSIVIIIEFK